MPDIGKVHWCQFRPVRGHIVAEYAVFLGVIGDRQYILKSRLRLGKLKQFAFAPRYLKFLSKHGIFQYRAVETAMTDKNNPVERRRLLHHLLDLLVIIRPAPDIP